MKRTAIFFTAAALVTAACGSTRHGAGWMPPAPPSPARPWQPPAAADAIREVPDPAKAPPAVPAEGRALTLDQVLDVALQNNPRTRAAWAASQAAWAEWGSRKSAYYPSVDLTGNLARAKQTVGGQLSDLQTTYGPSVALTALLYDFGRREADAGAAQAAFLASGFALNAVLADTVLEVEETYYGYLNARALLEAAQSSLADAEESLKAAEDRRRAGVATIAETLQARTVRSRALLAVQESDGRVQALKGALATVMGLPATQPLDAEPLPDTIVPPDTLDETIEELVETALAGRPDLEAARARALEASREARKIRADAWPSLTAGATLGRNHYFHADRETNDYYSGFVGLRVPLFTGFEHAYALKKAEAEAAAARAETHALADQVVLQVWNSFFAVQTALKRLATSADLLASADESAAVALGRYKSGVGTILDLLAAQSSLVDARAQSVLARSDCLVSVARLAHDTGRLRIPEAASEEN